MFEQSMVARNGGARRVGAVLMSSVLQVLLILTLIAVPIVFTSELPGVVLAGILRSPGPPPAPPPRPPETRVAAQPLTPHPLDPRIFEPRAIPQEIALIVEEAPPQVDAGPSVVGGIGPADGSGVSVIGSFVSQVRQALPPPPVRTEPKPAAQPKQQAIQRLRVGGEVDPPVLLRRVEPRYPPIAVQTRTQGVVRIECIIGADGRVTNMQVVGGPALLVQAAMDAVRQWRYRPTMLNGDPVEVVMRIDVRFQLR